MIKALLSRSINNIIKPASPTPSPLKCYNLCPMNQLSPNNYIPIVFYYRNKVPNVLLDIAVCLKRSLSEILVQYYPFAGRLNSKAYVDCNDEGIEFQEVNIKCKMSEILERSYQDKETLGVVFPDGLIWGNVNKNSPLLVIRLTSFECGGLSIAVCLSHKLCDAKSFSTFMTSWATKTRLTNISTKSEDDVQEYTPQLISYPSSNDTITVPEYSLSKEDYATRRFVFPNSKIDQLKKMVGHNPELGNTTRLEVLAALIYKCATAARTTSSGCFSPTVLVLPVNMRSKMIPPLPETSIGNFYWQIHIPTTNESETDLNALVEKIKKAKMDIRGMENLDAIEQFSTIVKFARNNYNLFLCSSLCRMEFNQIDFGWGNPCRVSFADTPSNNNCILMDMLNGDSIEALISLEEQNMVTFQRDKEILAFTSSKVTFP